MDTGSEVGWEFAVPCPNRFAPGLIPYPLIIHGPKIQGLHSTAGMTHEYETILQRLTTEESEMKPKDKDPKFVKQFRAVIGKGCGPIETGELVLDNMDVDKPGRYQLMTSYHVYLPSKNIPIRRIVVVSKPFDVEVSYDNSDVQLDNNQINLINQAMQVNGQLKKLYGDFIAKIEVNLN